MADALVTNSGFNKLLSHSTYITVLVSTGISTYDWVSKASVSYHGDNCFFCLLSGLPSAPHSLPLYLYPWP